MNDIQMESPLIEFHRAAGAELARYFGVLLPAQFDDVLAEYRTASQAVALLDTNFRTVFSLTGPDRARYLNAVLTSNVRDLQPGQGTVGLLLNAQGHILAELQTLACEDKILIIGHALVRDKTAEILEKFIIMDDATLTDETAHTGTIAIEGPLASAIVHDLTGIDLTAMPPRGHAVVNLRSGSGAEISCRLLRSSVFGFTGAEFLVPRDTLSASWGVLAAAVANKGTAIGYRALNALRLEAGIPWFSVDFGEQQIPHEAALENTHISFTKGCYTGQEIVERVRSRGHVNRRLTGVQFDGSETPPSGAALAVNGADAGHITSAAFSPRAGRAIGMAYLRREFAKPGTPIQCGNSNVELIDLPLRSSPAAG